MDIYKNFLGADTALGNSEKRQLILAFGSAEELYHADVSLIKKANVLDDVKIKKYADHKKDFDLNQN